MVVSGPAGPLRCRFVTELDATVLIPLMDDRRTGERCVRAWTRDQTYPRERYEVIALAPGVDPALEAGIRPLLGPADRLVVDETRVVVGLLNRGAKQARGRILFLTEAHCEPDPGCLAALMARLEAGSEVGVRGASIGRATSALGELERDFYVEAQDVGKQDGHWNRVLIHSFAIRREVFEAVGGFRSELGDFSNFALGIELAERGLPLGFAPDAEVFHTYDGDLAGLGAHIADFGRGQARYYSETPAPLRLRYGLDELPAWTNRAGDSRAGARRALRAARALGHRDPGVLREAARHLVVALDGPRGAARLAQAQILPPLARTALRRGSGAARMAALQDFWRAAAHYGIVDWLSRSRELECRAPAPAAEHDLTILDAQPMIGFGRVEHWQDRAFRWTAPLALVQVTLPPGDRFEAHLGTLPVRPDEPEPDLRVTVDGRRVPAKECVTVADGVRFPVTGGGPHWIALAATPLRPRRSGSNDRRNLGLAVTSLRVRPAG